MKRLLAALLLASAQLTEAADSSGTLADFRTWIANAGTVDGDTFTMDAGTYAVTQADGEVIIDKSIRLIGAGKDSTILTDQLTDNTVAMVEWDLPSTGKVTMTGFTFRDGGTGHSGNKASLLIEGGGTLVLGDLEFESDLGQRSILIQQTGICGVIYDCEVAGETGGIYVRHEEWNGGVGGDGSWEEDVDYGSPRFIYIEDCFRNSGADNSQSIIDGNGGARAVVRFSTITNGHVLFHGNDSSNTQRSGRAGMAHHNTMSMDWASGGQLAALVGRGGSWRFFNNTVNGDFNSAFQMKHYRTDNGDYRLWNAPDGTIAWDENVQDTGDVPFASGTTTGGGESFIEDSGASWTVDEWISDSTDYWVVKVYSTFTADSVDTGARTITVSPSPSWDTTANGGAGEWEGWVIEEVSTGERSQVLSNTADTLTYRGSPYPTDPVAAAEQFRLVHGQFVTDNTATRIDLNPSKENSTDNYTYKAGQTYEIRKITHAFDMPSAGKSDPWPGTRLVPSDLNQADNPLDPFYVFNNSGTATYPNGFTKIATLLYEEDIHYFHDGGTPGVGDGTTGVGTGTYAQMMAITPTTDGVGFWVTDRGGWNTTTPGADGEFWIAESGAWVKDFEPYIYPHPLRLDQNYIQADTPSQADVQAAVDLASSGDMVVVPFGTATYTEPVEVVGKNVTVVGMGGRDGGTVITYAVLKANSSLNPTFLRQTCFAFDNLVTDGNQAGVWGFKFQGDGVSGSGDGTAGVIGAASDESVGAFDDFRVFDCWFDDVYNGNDSGGNPDRMRIAQMRDIFGVWHDCIFEMSTNSTPMFYVENLNTFEASNANGDGPWENAVDYGSSKFLFIEDSVATASGGINPGITDGSGGSLAVIRYSNLTDVNALFHSAESSRDRGGRAGEYYYNTVTDTGPSYAAVNARGGTWIAHNNTFTGSWSNSPIKLGSYRAHKNENQFMGADGTSGFDVNDTSDGAGTPGGAGDGVFESGTTTAGSGVLDLEDSSKTWSTTGNGEWAGYVARVIYYSGTTTAGDATTLTVSGAGWTVNQFGNGSTSWPHEMTVTKTSTGEQSRVLSNTADTITLDSTSGNYVTDYSGGPHAFTVTTHAHIRSNTATELVLESGAHGSIEVDSGLDYEIRRVTQYFDAGGYGGVSSDFSTSPVDPGNVTFTQGIDPSYEWNNTWVSNPWPGWYVYDMAAENPAYQEGTHYHDETSKPGYTPYTYPHPLRFTQPGTGDATATTINATTTNVGP